MSKNNYLILSSLFFSLFLLIIYIAWLVIQIHGPIYDVTTFVSNIPLGIQLFFEGGMFTLMLPGIVPLGLSIYFYRKSKAA
ncbi:MAG: hypothetical protein LBI43_06395 [Streptococcaceae bacterium]|jgi:hypothetical protein|nr:hypothetical protein [Streptococcaceae bacterium]